jgi:acetolactate synthase-1/2/3 large subunit
MGCALPSALGVCANSSKKTFCITGDGSFMSNIQELATLKYHNYDLTILLLNNGGYLSISNTQKNNYGENRVFGAQNKKGLLFPDFKKISAAFEIKYKYIEKIKDLNELNETGPAIIEIKCIEDEIIAPYQARIEGKQAGAHDMAPHKDTTELKHYSSTNLNFIR